MVVLGDVGLGISLGAVFSFVGIRTRYFYAGRARDLTLSFIVEYFKMCFSTLISCDRDHISQPFVQPTAVQAPWRKHWQWPIWHQFRQRIDQRLTIAMSAVNLKRRPSTKSSNSICPASSECGRTRIQETAFLSL